ncbi:hypothetical protein [Arenibaculum sp.]|uniref:hypothetical protein n=1 Tax=Arenibaculum sp. TaxID=2865862 RepID=UPI002E167734|nr:hypothetical protein [Arenibaculum sp.]
MHRIDTASRAVDLFGPGKHGFKNGDPLSGDPATALNADWFNGIQEELAAAIEGTGATLNAASSTQLLEAIRALAPPSFRNLLINAAFLVNQRVYVSGAATMASNQYTLDRWRVVTNGQSVAFSADEIVAPAGGVEQVVEGSNIETGSYVLDWLGTATATVNGVLVAKRGAVSLTSGSDATVRFIGGAVRCPQLERGTIATPFERRPFGAELALCQRYYEKSYDLAVAPGTPNAYAGASAAPTQNGALGAVVIGVRFQTRKRVTPVVATYSPETGTVAHMRDGTGTPSAISIGGSVGQTGFRAYNSGFALAANSEARMHWVADAEL